MEGHVKKETVATEQEPLQGKVAWSFESCNYCSYKTQSVHIMNNHLKRHKVTRHSKNFYCNMYIDRYQCRMCDFDADTLVSYKKHIKVSHEKVVEIKPEQNPFIKKEQTEKFVFGNFISLVKKPNSLKRFKCQLCGFKSHSVLTHLKHSVDCVSVMNEEIINRGSENEETETADEGPEQDLESVSDKGRENEVEPENHDGSELHNDKTIVEEPEIDDPIWSFHNYAMKPKTRWYRYRCKDCDFRAPNRSLLNLHVKKHRSRKNHQHQYKYKCVYDQKCQFSTTRLKDLNEHKRSVHDPSKIFECNYCDFSSTNVNFLNLHIETKHEQFECPKCESVFLKKVTLQVHLAARHSIGNNRAKRFRCSLCKFCAKLEVSLLRHIETRHPGSVTVLRCEQCRYKTMCPDKFKAHVDTKHKAKGSVCDKCGFTTDDAAQWNSHLEEDCAGDWLSCPSCYFKCKESSELRQHILDDHVASESVVCYKCQMCSFKTIDKEELKGHLLDRHMPEGGENRCGLCTWKGASDEELKRHIWNTHYL